MSDKILEMPLVPQELADAAEDGKLVLFIGAGISRLVGCPSWEDFAKKVLDQLIPEIIDHQEKSEIESISNPRQQLSIAIILAKQKNENIDYKSIFSNKISKEENIYNYINQFNCHFVTTNYDTFINPEICKSNKKKESDWRCYDVGENILDLKIDDSCLGNVIHLHGCIEEKSSMIITTKDYLQHYQSEAIDTFLKYLFEKKTVLFLGYGLEEIEILEYILKKGTKEKEKRIFILQGFFEEQQSLFEKLKTYYQETFYADLIAYSRNKLNYGQQIEIMKMWSKHLDFGRVQLVDQFKEMKNELGEGKFIKDNRSQKRALDRVVKNPELFPKLFDIVEGLEWFDEFDQKGWFDPALNPKPEKTEEGYYRIPPWSITNYLVKSAHHLKQNKYDEYIDRYLDVLRNTTNYAKKNKFSNYRTWHSFSKIIQFIPLEKITDEDISLIKYWLTDKYHHNYISEELGKWILNISDKPSDQAKKISLFLLNRIYQIEFVDDELNKKRKKAILSNTFFNLNKKTGAIARKASILLGNNAVNYFKSQLEFILEKENSDKFSHIWRPAIEDHRQSSIEDAQNILTIAVRDSLIHLFENNSKKAMEILELLFNSKYHIIIRIAIYISSQKYSELPAEIISKSIHSDYFCNIYRHEIWHLLKGHFKNFPNELKQKVLDIIDEITILNRNSVESRESAYERSIWLAAIKDADNKANEKYKACIATTGSEPDHPDFSSYMSREVAIPRTQKSPIKLEYLRSLDYELLVKTLNNYKGGKSFIEPGIEGLAYTFKELVKLDIKKIYCSLDPFINLDIPYIYALLEAFQELLKDKQNILPWHDIWKKLLGYIHSVINEKTFWDWPEERDDTAFVANHHWVVKSISNLIELGCNSRDHYFNINNIEPAKKILEILLNNEKGSEFSMGCDAVSITINSSRGRCLIATINLALFACKNSEDLGITHLESWKQYEPIFNSEFNKVNEYEFATLIAMYLPNFIFLSKKWSMNNLPVIFDLKNHLKWLCAMQGYSYIRNFNLYIYNFLKKNGHLIKVLDDDSIEDRVKEHYLQLIALSYYQGNENIKDRESLILTVLERKKDSELKEVIESLWQFGKNVNNVNVDERQRVYQLWGKILEIIDVQIENNHKLASQLCLLSVFVDTLDKDRVNWLTKIAPYADVDFNSYILLEMIIKFSTNSSNIEHLKNIWLQMISKNTSHDPKIIKSALLNFRSHGTTEKIAAKKIESKYLKNEIDINH